ncbi:MAG: Glutamate-semialdehyde aminotransferase [Gemmatimonadetes bacterium]|nr:Glutamate-semialdehyde aminotransferase [Gemmatimonadota bacterium]
MTSQATPDTLAVPAIAPAASLAYRLSPQQKRRWAHERRTAAVQCALRIPPGIDPADLRAALDTVVGRHEALRTTFLGRAGLKVPLQVVHDAGTAGWSEWALPASGDEEAARRAIDQALAELRGRELDPASGPLVHAVLLTRDGAPDALLLRVSGLCADPASLANVARELAALLRGDAASLPADDDIVQYLQFSDWQHETMEGEEAEEASRHWAKHPWRTQPALNLPFVAGEAGGDPAPGSAAVPIDDALLLRADALASEQGATVELVLLACWKALLWRLTGQPDVVVATVSDGRPFDEMRTAVGLYACALPTHARIDPAFRFTDVLRRTRKSVEESRTWQDRFAGVLESSGHPLPEVAFEYVEWPAPPEAGDVRLPLHALVAAESRAAVKLFCVRQGTRLHAEVQYDGSRVSGEAARHLADQYRAALAGAVGDPARTVEELDLLTEGDRARIAAFNGTDVEWPAEGCVHEWIEAAAARSPGALAVRYEDEVLTFGELAGRAARLARRLQGLGVGPDVPVGVLLERSTDWIVAILGVMKAGGAYVPLEPNQPPARLQRLVEQAGCGVVVTTDALRERVAGAETVSVHAEAGPSDRHEPSGRAASAGSLAYVLFTSGSTGQPKAVAVEHRQLASYVRGITRELAPVEGGTFAMVSTFAADLGHTVLFGSLCSGGCLHVISPHRVLDPDAFREYCARHAIDYLKIVPSHLSALLAGADAAGVLPRRALVLGGEASSWELVDRVRALAPGLRIVNHYGPTEATVGVLTHDVPAEGARPTHAVPLGRPLPNSRVHLLDAALRPVPTYGIGELYVGGRGLARGYLGRPEMTAERFVPDPTGTQPPGGRLYRTGDLGRFHADGTLEFLGRADHQVKIRGFRVEPGEIEAVLRTHPGVREAVVALREAPSGEPRLAAYLVAAGAGPAPAEELRRFAQEQLPEHMVPALLVWLAALPLTANGKVDRRALPEPDERSAPGRPPFVPPRSLGEELLASLWCDVLGAARVGVHDNFFALGGDSLLGTRLVSRIRKTFDVELPVRALFDAPTVGQLAAALERFRQGNGAGAPPMEPLPAGEAAPLSFGQERLWVMHQLDPDSAAYNSTAPLRLRGPLHADALERALAEIVRRHQVLRTALPSHEGRAAPRLEPPECFRMERIDLEGMPEESREAEAVRLAAGEAERPFDLARAPMLRATLVRLHAEHHALLLTLHHVASDGWSLGVLVREVVALYDAFARDEPSPLAELAVQYGDFAAWQRRWLAGPVLDGLTEYWVEQLRGAPEELRLPLDRPRPPKATHRGATLVVERGEAVKGALQELSRAEGATLFMTALAAFYVLLHRFTGQDDLVVGTDVANRNRIETEGLIGFFVNNLALRADLSGNPTFREILARVRSTALGAYAHQDLPLASLVKALRTKRSLAHTPLFQVLFVLQNTPPLEARPGGLDVGLIEFDATGAKFDLALFVTETDAGLTEQWTYRTDLFDRATVEEMARAFGTVLQGILRDASAPLRSLTSE